MMSMTILVEVYPVMLMAHNRDITLNQLVEELLSEYIEPLPGVNQ